MRWIRAFLPSSGLAAWLVPASAAYAIAAAALCGWLRVSRGVRVPYTRKVFHFFIFTMASAVQVRWGLPGTVVFGSVVALLVLLAVARGEGFPFYEAIARPTDEPHRTLFILVPLATTAAGGLAASLLFPGAGHIGYLVAGWGDAVGEPVGSRWGRHRYTVPSLVGVRATRSIEGSAAVLLLGALAAFLGLWLGGLAPGRALAVGAACGGVGAAVESVSSHGLDNFTVQLAAAGTAFLLMAA